ncbi:hypothetical protein mRhiFer1_008307 [Rhinolophus ferrumequinum]|uniref:Uncharacterized protein n=1 Tax=Rhinolophus ferrumequinum TaxID=59479 RepID=A0A7J7VRG6_RHIFE|nr:hypothetical protein mRhiFer1_008307 [Rhinolophus ferrumequinum]
MNENHYGPLQVYGKFCLFKSSHFDFLQTHFLRHKEIQTKLNKTKQKQKQNLLTLYNKAQRLVIMSLCDLLQEEMFTWPRFRAELCYLVKDSRQLKANIDRSPDPGLEFELVLSQMSSSKFTFKLPCQSLKVKKAGDNQLYLEFPS